MKWIVVIVMIWAALTWFRKKPVAVGGPAVVAPDQAEARAILGIAADADDDAVRAAHRRLVAGVHPDRGGSAELARRVNAARDVLLARPR